MIYLQLFWVYLKIGLFGFGGGYSMLSLIQYETVQNHQWLTQQQFTDIVAISQMTPGPIGINSATYVGYTVTGSVWGSVVATLSVVLPSFVIMLALCYFLLKVRGNKNIDYIFKGMRVAIIGLIGSAALLLMTPENFYDRYSIMIFIFAVGLNFFSKVHPIALIIGAGLAGYLIY